MIMDIDEFEIALKLSGSSEPLHKQTFSLATDSGLEVYSIYRLNTYDLFLINRVIDRKIRVTYDMLLICLPLSSHKIIYLPYNYSY